MTILHGVAWQQGSGRRRYWGKPTVGGWADGVPAFDAATAGASPLDVLRRPDPARSRCGIMPYDGNRVCAVLRTVDGAGFLDSSQRRR